MKVIVCFGTRPEAIKMAPVVHALRLCEGIDTRILNTGQHKELIQPVLDLFDLRPDASLDVMRNNDSLNKLTSRILIAGSDYLRMETPNAVIVHGDTTTTMAMAMSSFYLKIPVYHVEAGLRSWDYMNPFPEEMNRSIVGRLASHHFAPTEGAKQNLMLEGVCEEKITVTGNTVIDALFSVVAKVGNSVSRSDVAEVCARAKSHGRQIVLVTCHRRENFGAGLINVCSAVKCLAKTERFEFIFVLHMNPLARNIAISELSDVRHVEIVEAIDYVDTIKVLKSSRFVLTDSGGLQEEAPALGIPVLVMRETTERPEGIVAGVAKLVGTDVDLIINSAMLLSISDEEHGKMAKAVNPYGDGKAGEKIADFFRNLTITTFEFNSQLQHPVNWY